MGIVMGERRLGLTAEEKAWAERHFGPLPRPGWQTVVTDGYELMTSELDDGQKIVIGRSALQMELAEDRLNERCPDSGLRGLFYPGATPSGPPLWQAVLYFDETFVIHPGRMMNNPFGSNPLTSLLDAADQGDETAQRRLAEFYEPGLDEFAKKIADEVDFLVRLRRHDAMSLPLKQAGVLRAISPRAQNHPDFYDLLLADVDDPRFREMVSAEWREPVYLARAKGGIGLQPLKDVGRKRIAEAMRRQSSPFGSVFDSHPSFGVHALEPALAASVLLNHAFLTAERHGLIPFTDDPLCARLMRRKLDRVTTAPDYDDFRRLSAAGAAALSLRVLEEHVPRFDFRTPEDALEARAKLAGPLTEFRTAMAAMAAEIEASPYDLSYAREVERTVATRIRPAISALETEIRTSRDSFVSKVVRNTQAGTIPIVGSIFAGLPASAVIAISAGVLTFEAVVETYLETSRKKRNAFALLLRR